MSIFIYYVYAYLREDGSPYYIGKGNGRRAYSRQHTVKIPKDKSRIIFLETNLSDTGALALERRHIRWYGRKDTNTGILRNMTDGGEGTTNISLEMRKEISRRTTGINNGMYGKKHSLETRKKLSEDRLGNKNFCYGKPLSLDHKRKIGESLKKSISEYWLIIDPNGCKMKIKNLREFCRNNKLDQSNMWKVSKGIAQHHKHWKCQKINPDNQ